MVGKHVDFPTERIGFIPAKVCHKREIDYLSESLESILLAFSGLKFSSSQNQMNLSRHEARADRLEGSLQGLTKQIEILSERLEFSRKESLLEIQRLSAPPNRKQHERGSVTRIKNHELVQAQLREGNVKLNLGCGHIPLDGYINVDIRDLPGVDVVSHVDSIPFESDSVSEIRSSHLLEHFRADTVEKILLPYWLGLLRPGGVLRTIVPDGAAMMRAYASGDMCFEHIREVTYGSQEYEGNLHYNMFSSSTLADVLQVCGFVEIEVVSDARRNGLCLELEIAAEKPK
jgi:hypothetical protein